MKSVKVGKRQTCDYMSNMAVGEIDPGTDMGNYIKACCKLDDMRSPGSDWETWDKCYSQKREFVEAMSPGGMTMDFDR